MNKIAITTYLQGLKIEIIAAPQEVVILIL